jgi:glycosyltransferase involved in cell wall biosynthesis
MRIAYVEHPHHQKTNSTEFFRKEVEALGHELVRIVRDSFSLEVAQEFDRIILFQADDCIPIAVAADKLSLVVPMLDESLMRNSGYFRVSKKVQFVSFSPSLHQFLQLSGAKSHFVQYWPEPKIKTQEKDFNVFFWERTPVHVSVQDVYRWFKNMNPNFIVRRHLDPGQVSLEPTYLGFDKNVKVLDDKWLTHDQYLANLERAKVFVAPRRWEGIGLSSLEAMSRGIPVVGLASPTLSEYIEDGVTGILIKDKFSSLKEVDFDTLSKNLIKVLPLKHELFRKQIASALGTFFLSNDSILPMGPTQAVIPKSMTLRQFLYLRHRI